MPGFGTTPFGSGPYGIGTPATSSTNEGKPLTDAKGVRFGSRYINPRTRQYEMNANGRYVGMSSVQQLVELAALTLIGTSAMQALGEDAPSGVIGTNYVARTTEAIERAFARLVREKLIEINSIDIRPESRPVFRLVRWTDLTTGIEQELRI